MKGLSDRTCRFLAAAACVLITGCGGGGSGGPAPAEPPPQGPGKQPPTQTEYPTFDANAAAQYAKGGEFIGQTVGLPSHCIGKGTDCTIPNSTYELQNIHYAHTAKLPDGTALRGQGKRIAIAEVANGFRITHQELAGKDIVTYPDNAFFRSEGAHATDVAALAAGRADGKGMMGVAPEAGLHLSTISVLEWAGDAIGATNDAAEHGAVVQNNSWGIGDEDETAANDQLAAVAQTPTYAYSEVLSSQEGQPAETFRRLFDAYKRFQKQGVIVFANSNHTELGTHNGGEADVAAWAALPLFVEELRGAWIVVSDAYFMKSRQHGGILDAELLSAPCGSAAAFCLTTNGVVRVPSGDSNDGYYAANGTSYAAPQVAGMVALLAQAFPNLSPQEWTTRLLATAQRDWKSFRDTISGETEFAPGVTRPHSSLYGHGLPDMKAALSPVGGLSVATGGNVFSGERVSLSGGISTAGPVIGNSAAKAIADRDLMVVDTLGTDFYLRGSMLGGGANIGAASPANARHLARNVDQVAATFAFTENGGPVRPMLHDAAVPKLFFSQSLANFDGGTAFSRVMPVDKNAFLQFSGHIREKADGGDAAFSLSHLLQHKSLATELSLSLGQSFGGFFGTETRGPFVSARNTSNAAAGIGVARELSKNWTIGAYGELGSGFVDDGPSALADYGAFAYASGGLNLRRRALLGERDTVDLYAGVRPKAVAGKADLRLPVARDRDGTIRYENLEVDLAAADLPLRLGVVYRTRTERDFDLLLGFNTDLTASKDPDPGLSVSLGLKKEF